MMLLSDLFHACIQMYIKITFLALFIVFQPTTCEIAIKSNLQQKTIRIAAYSFQSATPVPLPPRHFSGNERCKKITIIFAMPRAFFVLIFILT